MQSFQVFANNRGVLVIPRSLRELAQLGDEDNLVATPLPGGGFTVKTRRQILEAFWSRLTTGTALEQAGIFLEEEPSRKDQILLERMGI